MSRYPVSLVSLSKRQRVTGGALVLLALLVGGCEEPEAIAPDRYREPDRLFATMEQNVAASPALETIVSIDHSRLGAQAGSAMPPARVLIFSNAAVESGLLALNPLIGLDLPIRALAYESVPDGEARVIFNSFTYLRSRYGMEDHAELEAAYGESLSEALAGIPPASIAEFSADTRPANGIVTLSSPFDFETTRERLIAAIDSQDDTVRFGEVDFQQRSREQGIELQPALLILFGGPAPGAKAMAEAPTLGLDAFCQKLLVWEDQDGSVHVSFNDLLVLAERQQVPKSVALRVINRRLNSVFREALEVRKQG